MKKIFLSFIIVIIVPLSFYAQANEKIRFPNQHYVEDSTTVFWTWYPNPFSPPTVIVPIDYDTVKSKNCISPTFYCELSDTVLVAFQNESDSIYYNKYIVSKIPPYFKFCLWVAGSKTDYNELPEKYFYCKEGEKFRIFLIVGDRKKCYKEFENLNKYIWIE